MIFELTEEQKEIVAPIREIAVKCFKKGKPGVIIAQFHFLKDDEAICEFKFIGHERAKKVIKACNE
jgi:hypothetical protein